MEDIYRRYSKMIYGFLFSKCADADTAEELTQETFYQAMKSIDRFRGESSVSTWLCGIAGNVWQQHLRNQSKIRTDISLDDLEASPDMPLSKSPSAEQLCLERLSTFELLKLLHKLDEPTREIMYLRLMGELSFKEIGQIMGFSENRARVSFYRGKEKLIKGGFDI